MFSESQTVEPHVIIHAAVSQITVEKIKKEKKKENLIPFVLQTQKEPHKRNTVSLRYMSRNTVQSMVRCSNCSACYTLTTG